MCGVCFFFFKQKTAYEMRISDWSSDVCSSDLTLHVLKESGLATLMVTHDAEEAMFMGDRIAVMRDGRLVQAGTPDMLYCKPADAFVAQFFGEVNRLEGVVRNGTVETPLGSLPSRNLPEGAPAEVLIRPEALRLGPARNGAACAGATNRVQVIASRSEEHTSELQSLMRISYAVCCLKK